MNLDHIFVDVGLSESNIKAATVTGMAAVRTDRKGKALAAYSESSSIRGLVDADVESIYGNLVATLIKPFPEQYVVVAQHANAYKEILGPTCFRGKTWLDIAQLAWPLGYCDMIPDRDLDTLCKHFNMKNAMEDSMSGNAEALCRVYWAMMTRYKTALIGEEAVRDFGGEALQGLRKFIGI